jgi:integrase
VLEPFIVLALVVGVRHGELLALRWQDIDLAQGTLTIHHTLTLDERYHHVMGDPKTKSSERTILLPEPICKILIAHRARQREVRQKAGPEWQNHDLVFCNRKGGYLWESNVRQQFYRMLNGAGLPFMHIHDLRHSASTLLRKMGVDLKVIQEILGHSTLDMTANVYSHVLPSMQQEAVEKMKTLFEKPS